MTVLNDEDCSVAVSEHGLLEFSNAMTTNVGKSDEPEYDEDWFDRCFAIVMLAIADGRLQVIDIPVKAAERAMVLRRISMEDHSIALQVWDGYHLIIAAEWAESLGQNVEILCSDFDFSRFLDRYPHFRSRVRSSMLEP